ncbi:hypothetical protein RHGRI_002569 [Rhododendron griersonianum]|uniref:Glutaredoxin domain-containing protein n=1 Tax=Rhododendron griersonianum TaxID=479676 RepID=A0AAV6LSF8_9ERIC|nr:hypothetical protein RHGRI_002569 [Rhododendron griersonianum]
MWLQRANPPGRARASSSHFATSSFKDIQHLCAAADDRPPKQPKQPSIFHRVRLANSLLRAWSTHLNAPRLNAAPAETLPEPAIYVPGAETRIIVYFTSLRVVRSTFEDCQAVRSILRGFRVSIDERDVSMDHKFMDELQGILADKVKGKITLPRVFIGGRYFGGAEEVKQLHEVGELKKVVGKLPAADPGVVCEVCGGYRFILCDECSGSHKCYTEKSGFRTCGACNENGLIRCPSCLSTV